MMPPKGLMAGMEDQEEVEAGAVPPGSDTRQHDRQEVEDTDESGNAEPNVSPEEQAAYEQFVEAGIALIYGGGEVRPGILQLLDNDPADLIAVLGDNVPELKERFSKVVALAATTVIVVLEVVRNLPEKPDGAILMHGGKAILEDLAELAEQAGQEEFTQDELNTAFLHAVDIYQAVGTEEGFVDKENASQEFAEILNAQEQGQLDKVLPGLERGMNDG